jgi:hypothetical protein
VFYTVTRLLPPAAGIAIWAWLRDGSLMDPANVLLAFALLWGAFAIAAVRRYWVIRKTSKSRRDSSLLA